MEKTAVKLDEVSSKPLQDKLSRTEVQIGSRSHRAPTGAAPHGTKVPTRFDRGASNKVGRKNTVQMWSDVELPHKGRQKNALEILGEASCSAPVLAGAFPPGRS